MGFSGEIVFGRSERPLHEAPVFDGGRADGSDIDAGRPRPGGWQTLHVFDGAVQEGEDLLEAVVDWTGAPACVASVYDSDVALVTGLAPDGRWWQAALNVDLAAALWTEVPDDVDDTSEWADSPEFAAAVELRRAELHAEIPAAATGAVAWARSAGVEVTTPVAAVEGLLRAREVFVEDLFGELLDRLGFPEAAEPQDDDTD
ncbi:hypothetical protein [Streptomyces xantholiticus]|uniref:hypothetical protein n=1 Tax=Streptomyces xantholiticus TaxID=68285 RepID=UPI00167B7F0A|nr:hypothetical protein [Streptomyces xantholiticus]GGW48563.1 hypothetical protein GCM10010381_37490 [Streptomyces xantholiticus]